MSRPRLFGCAVLAVLALLMGCVTVAAADTRVGPPRAGASAQASPSASAWSGASVSTDTGGPACAPSAPERGGTPAVPARAWGEHAQVPLGRAAPEVAGPPAAVPVRSPLRGPDRPAPDRLELCVMRV
ncbi:hypothetical protein ACGFYY_13130 [Streptomyces sp. NPDC048331]|uniref:hypothetical protein n=1 Tax=Streptomyces sp. NPDC048331 TaxID=3365534 RepID=UPI00371DB9BB